MNHRTGVEAFVAQHAPQVAYLRTVRSREAFDDGLLDLGRDWIREDPTAPLDPIENQTLLFEAVFVQAPTLVAA